MGEQGDLDGVDYGTTGPADADQENGLASVSFDLAEPATIRNAPATLVELAWQARAVCRAVTLPRAIQGKPGDVLAVMLAGRELGLGPIASTRMIHIISGTTVIATELKVALAKRDGHELAAVAEGPGWCVVGCRTHPSADPVAWAMTRELAEHMAGELDTRVPAWDFAARALRSATIAGQIMVEGWEGPSGNRKKVETPLVDKANWRSYQRDMLFWRAQGAFMRRHCPAVGGGIYTLEELGEEGADDGS